jgi:hypothetical protein
MGCREPAVGALLLRESLILGGPLDEVPATEVWPLATRENILSDSVGTTGDQRDSEQRNGAETSATD